MELILVSMRGNASIACSWVRFGCVLSIRYQADVVVERKSKKDAKEGARVLPLVSLLRVR